MLFSPVKPLPPGPRGKFFFGHFADYMNDPLEFLTRSARQFGDVVALRLPATRIFLLSHPEHIERVLTTTHTDFINHGGMRLGLTRRLFGNGLLLSEGDEWQRQRSLTFPHFQHSRIADYAAIMQDETARMLSSWKSGETLDIYREMISLNLRVMSRTLFGVDLSAQSAEIAAAFDTLKDGFLVKNWYQSVGMILPLPIKSSYAKALGQIEKTVAEIIRQRSAEDSENGDLLSVLMGAQDLEGKPISLAQLRDEVKTFLVTGHQTSGAALGWAFYLLAQAPPAQTIMRDEVLEISGEGVPNLADLKQLKYTLAVFKETLRLYPPGWLVGRESVHDCEIGGHLVPAGSQIVMSQWIVHRDSRFWDAPDEFRPDRWLDEEPKRRPKYAYFPYSGGPRFCLGSTFAEMFSLIVLGMVAQKFQLELIHHPEVEPLPSFNLVPKHGVKVKLHPAL